MTSPATSRLEAITAVRAAATEGEREAAGGLECQWQRAQLPQEIRELALDDQRLRNELCWLRSTADAARSRRPPHLGSAAGYRPAGHGE